MQPTHVERLSGSWVNRPRVLSIHPAIGDTSSLIADILASTRLAQISPLLLAMKVGVVRLHIAHNVWAEVPRKLQALGAAGLLHHEIAEDLWWREYVPLTRVVDASGLPEHSRIEPLRTRDASDVPTAVLADLLAPAVVLAADLDLVDLGYAANEWRHVANAARDLALAGEVAYGTLVAVNVASQALLAAASGVGRILRHSYGRLVLAATSCAVVLLATRKYRRTSPANDAPVAANSRLGWLEPLAEFVQGLQMTVDAAYVAWDAALRGVQSRTITHATARELAVAPSPLSRSELASRLQPEFGGSRSALIDGLRRMLTGCSAFVEVSPGKWQLGRAGVDFGVGAEWALKGRAATFERRVSPESIWLGLAHTAQSPRRWPAM